MKVQDQSQELSGVLETLSATIGERIKIEDSLREIGTAAERHHFLHPRSTLVIDREGKVIVWNRAIEEMTGVREEDSSGGETMNTPCRFITSGDPFSSTCFSFPTRRSRKSIPSSRKKRIPDRGDGCALRKGPETDPLGEGQRHLQQPW
jgi:PAS domain-containing protein